MHLSIATLSNAILLLAAIMSGAACAAPADAPFDATPVADFEQPWVLAFLPSGELLVTEMRGVLNVYSDGETHEITGVPEVEFGGRAALATWSCIRISPATTSST